MHIRELTTAGIIALTLAPNAFADGVAQAVDGLESNVGTLEYDVGILESDVDALNAQLASLQSDNAVLQAAISSLTSIVDTLVEQQRCHAMPQAQVDWRGCDKSGVEGSYTNGNHTAPLWEANLINSDLRFVNFTGASMQLAQVYGANFEGANFTNAFLAGTFGFESANVIKPDNPAGLAPTIWANTTCPDGHNSDDDPNKTCIGHFGPPWDPGH